VDELSPCYLADRVVVYTGTPALDCVANTPTTLLAGMNQFLKHLEITFRRDPTNYRQGLTLVHFSAQPEPFLTQNTP
jgi:ATP-binding cassette subfamily E protein 1